MTGRYRPDIKWSDVRPEMATRIPLNRLVQAVEHLADQEEEITRRIRLAQLGTLKRQRDRDSGLRR